MSTLHGADMGIPALDLTALSPAAQNPFAISYGTPSSTSGVAPISIDSAYLPAFAFSTMTGGSADEALPAPSPSQFDLSDLPFSGMDFLQSLGSLDASSAGVTTEQNEALWAQLGASPFRVAPDLPFGVMESNTTTTS
ncbi:hypothetical protein DL93DRAFT_2081853 [Clavulina sp. PMI_390]|nr:hypothetical protein DL93DRAFT_2081853 [Clavulina sp. PMI_390]